MKYVKIVMLMISFTSFFYYDSQAVEVGEHVSQEKAPDAGNPSGGVDKASVEEKVSLDVNKKIDEPFNQATQVESDTQAPRKDLPTSLNLSSKDYKQLKSSQSLLTQMTDLVNSFIKLVIGKSSPQKIVLDGKELIKTRSGSYVGKTKDGDDILLKRNLDGTINVEIFYKQKAPSLYKVEASYDKQGTIVEMKTTNGSQQEIVTFKDGKPVNTEIVTFIDAIRRY